MATFGKVQEFNPDSDSLTAYIERVNLLFTANDIPTEKRVAVFLSVIGGKTYEPLCNLVLPKSPDSLKYSELVEVFKQHYEPKPLVIAEWFHFHRRNQTTSESVPEYMAELRRLSTTATLRRTWTKPSVIGWFVASVMKASSVVYWPKQISP